MIVYKNTADKFRSDVDTNQIADAIEEAYIDQFARRPNPKEKASWINSMGFMETVVRRSEISDDCGVLIEYNIPATSKRIDFIVSGTDGEGNKNFIIIELKQWQESEKTDKDGVVVTFLGGAQREAPHPSYQAHSYKMFLKDYNDSVYQGELRPHSCAYLHNYSKNEPEPLEANLYQHYIKDSPIYFKDDYQKLEAFLARHVKFGQGMDILYEIEQGRIRPSKKLIDHVNQMFKGNQEFILLDEQKVTYETALNLAQQAVKKTVLIVKGGPGTGKSVVSVNLLGGLLQEELNSVFVAPNAAFRNVMIDKLAQEHTKTRLQNLFKGSSSFYDLEANTFDVAVVDEAHRLKDDGAYRYRGVNQIEDIVNASKVVIFFVDDNQIIRPEDIGSTEELIRVAKKCEADIHMFELETQFRCSGAEGYVNWLNDILHIKETANFDGFGHGDFDFKIFEDPNALREQINEKQTEGFDARILAGYAWKWTKDGNPDAQIEDVVIPEFNFSMPWNSRRSRTTWAIDDNGINQVGCIHTSQGLEFDYVGVIIGNDLRFDFDTMEYYVDWNSYKDIMGKRNMKDKPEELSLLVRNIYKTLMSRGLKGCYLFIQDEDVRKYFKSRLKTAKRH